MRTHRFVIRLFRKTQGSSLVELALVSPVLILMLLGVIDLGRAYYLAMEIAGAAESAAAYGIQNPTDTVGINAAAQADAPDVPNLTVGTPVYGCECSDGSSYSTNCSTVPTCATNVVYATRVSVSANFSPLLPLPVFPSLMSISRSAEMRSGGS